MDIATSPSGGLTLFNLYLALSRSSGRLTIHPLRDLGDELLKKGHHAELLENLNELNEKTLKWWREMGRDTRSA